MRHHPPEAWGLTVGPTGLLLADGRPLRDLARVFGTPLHVVMAGHLRQRAEEFLAAARRACPDGVSVHYAMKCNGVPGVVEQIRQAGLGVEVCTEFELHLALRLGFSPGDIIVNGPGKTTAFLASCLLAGVRLIVVDALEELTELSRLANARHHTMDVLIRVNPGYLPEGVNGGTATASREGCAFGLDLRGGEIERALQIAQSASGIRVRGVHMHIGTGIRSPRAWRGALRALPHLRAWFEAAGMRIDIVDLGGGIASSTTREMRTVEQALYGLLGRLPDFPARQEMPTLAGFLSELGEGVREAFVGTTVPEVIFEPGRCIASASQCLLLSVLDIKRRPGIRTWVTVDGGLSTVTMPTYYECHDLLLCDDVRRPDSECVTVNGPACFVGDVVYRNIPLPDLRRGDILALMDSGAYFTALESSFGFPRPSIVLVDGPEVRRIRSRETFDDMLARDRFTGDGERWPESGVPDAPPRRRNTTRSQLSGGIP